MPLHMRLPKLKGFKNPFRTEYQVVNLDKLARCTPRVARSRSTDLVAKGAVRKGQLVKVLGPGEISVALQVTVDAVSGSAKEKIAAAGGSSPSSSEQRRGTAGCPERRHARVVVLGGTPSVRRALARSPVRVAGVLADVVVDPSRPSPSDARSLAAAQEEPCSPRSPGRSGRPTCARSCSSRWHHRAVPARVASSRPRASTTSAVQTCIDRASRTAAALRPGQPVQRRRAAPAVDLRAGDHAVHHGEHHPAAADRGDPAAGGPEEGGPGRHGEDHAVHPLPDGRRWRSCRPPACVATRAQPGPLFQGCPRPTSSRTDSLFSIVIMVITMTAGTARHHVAR